MWAGVELAKCSCSGEYWFLFVCYPWFLAGVPAHVPAAAAAGAPCGGGGGGAAAARCSDCARGSPRGFCVCFIGGCLWVCRVPWFFI